MHDKQKKPTDPRDAADDYEQAYQKSQTRQYVLRLYVSGITPRSRTAIQNIRKVCEENLNGRYTLEIIDIYQQPERIREEQILAAPTLIKKLPLPLRKMIGDMSNTERILIALDLSLKES